LAFNHGRQLSSAATVAQKLLLLQTKTSRRNWLALIVIKVTKKEVSMKLLNMLWEALLPRYDATQTNLGGAILVGIGLLLISQYAY
jgi:hypothetical protein